MTQLLIQRPTTPDYTDDLWDDCNTCGGSGYLDLECCDQCPNCQGEGQTYQSTLPMHSQPSKHINDLESWLYEICLSNRTEQKEDIVEPISHNTR